MNTSLKNNDNNILVISNYISEFILFILVIIVFWTCELSRTCIVMN